MASLGHVAVGIAAGRLHGDKKPLRWMVAFSLLSLAPDLDVIGFVLDVPYSHAFGHRGASHSLLVALLGAAIALAPQTHRKRAAVLGVLVLASHGLLDALTTGGLGAALFWPFTEARYFAPWRPLPVAPIGAGLMSARGAYVLAVEAVVFSPLLIFGLWPSSALKYRRSARERSVSKASASTSTEQHGAEQPEQRQAPR